MDDLERLGRLRSLVLARSVFVSEARKVARRAMTATQAGTVLGIAPGSVRARMCRATRRIRARAMVGAALLGAVVGASSGCAPDGGTPLFATRDSAGVTIVESSGPSWTPETAWSIDPVPLRDLGRTGTGPMYEFFRLEDATFGADGGIVVADRGSAQVRFYDAQGRFATALGADGDGPGEFRRLMGVARYAGDSVVAFDPSMRRGTVISASGALGRVVTFDIPDNTMTTPVVDDLHVPGWGDFILSVTVMPARMPSPGRIRVPQLVLETSATGALQDTVASMSGFEQYIGSTGLLDPPHARRSHAAVHRDELYVCDGDHPEYTVVGRKGTPRLVVRLPGLSLAVPQHVLDSIRDALRGKDEFLKGMAEVLLPTEPFCSGLLVDELGYVWVERFHHPFKTSDEPRSWMIFSPDGAWLGQVDFPPNFEVVEVEESRVLGMAMDSMEIQTVQVLGLRRRQRRMGVGLRPKRAGGGGRRT